MNLDAVATRLTPDPDDHAAILADAEAAREAAQAALGPQGQASIQGSIAKDTFLAGRPDIDLFLLLDPATPEAEFGAIASRVGSRFLTDQRQRYAQHPYVVGEFRGRTVDLVPAYAVASAGARMSAVDRTPFHTAWVRAHLDTDMRREVRLLKGWLKGTGTYGAQTAVGGLSGYLAEVLIAIHGGFSEVLSWLADDARPRRLAVAHDEVHEDAPLVVVDPVDPARNCAAAVQEDVLRLACEAARAFRDEPSEAFFFPAPPRSERPRTLMTALRAQRATWLGIVLQPRTDRLDIVLPQFQRAARKAAEALARAGFPVRRLDVTQLDEEVAMQWVVDDVRLPATVRHEGPPADSPHAQRFYSKWNDHPDAADGVQTEQGRLVVKVHVQHRRAADWLAHHLDALPGRHVQTALAGCRVVADPGAVPDAWAPRVADVVLDRRPWQR